ncbi:MAG: hypothetical protein U1F65_00090 [Verrucomicrobiota bacterium]
MSLVNDALKRASEVQKTRGTVPVVHLPLRPIDPPAEGKVGLGLVLPATVLTIIAAALFSLYLANRAEKSSSVPAKPTSATPVEKTEAKPVAQIFDLAPAPLVVAAKEVPVLPPAPVPAENPAPAAAMAVAPVAPPPLRLQAVFYTPPQPSAVINGKSVRVGDIVREMQVAAIGSSSVLLVSQSQTNFLTLE